MATFVETKISDDFVITLSRGRNAQGQIEYDVRFSTATLTDSGQVVRNIHNLSIYSQLAQGERDYVVALINAAEGKARTLTDIA